MGGGGKKPEAPPPPKKPPPPAEDITAEVIAPTLRQEAARRARAGAYVTKGQKLGAQGQVLGASPIRLANVAQSSGIYQDTPERKSIENFDTRLTEEIKKRQKAIDNAKSNRGGQQRQLKLKEATKKRQTAYDKYIMDYNKLIASRKKLSKQSSNTGGMTI